MTRGIRQAFFLGVMVSGLLHFLTSLYLCFFMAIGILEDPDLSGLSDMLAGLRYFHLIGIAAGAIGGACGMAAYRLLIAPRQESDYRANQSQVAASQNDSAKNDLREQLESPPPTTN